MTLESATWGVYEYLNAAVPLLCATFVLKMLFSSFKMSRITYSYKMLTCKRQHLSQSERKSANLGIFCNYYRVNVILPPVGVEVR